MASSQINEVKAMTGPEADVELRWRRISRWGPLPLLALGAGVSLGTAEAMEMTGGEGTAAAVLTLAALLLHVWWAWVEPRVAACSATAHGYLLARTVLAFVLTWLNPFFALYASVGYVDAGRLVRRRWEVVALLATAVTLAGSQSGGLPVRGVGQGLVFAVLVVLHAGIILTFTRVAAKEAELTHTHRSTIAELELMNTRLERALEENRELQGALLAQAREAGISDERRRLAAEIHDTLAQGLTGIITQLQAAVDNTDPDASRRHIERASELARRSLGEARRSVQDLSPAALEQDELPEALKKTTTEWSDQTGIPAMFTVTGAAEPLHDEIEATVLRIAQEALTNTAKHARATRVGVTLSFIDEEVTLDVRDDGIGFDPLRPPERDGTGKGGFGLGGMRARAERIAGTVEIESEPGGGTAVSARVPLVRHG